MCKSLTPLHEYIPWWDRAHLHPPFTQFSTSVGESSVGGDKSTFSFFKISSRLLQWLQEGAQAQVGWKKGGGGS